MFRLSQRITQAELAKILSVTRQTIISLETGKYQPSLSLAYKCAQYFEVPIEEIFRYTELQKHRGRFPGRHPVD